MVGPYIINIVSYNNNTRTRTGAALALSSVHKQHKWNTAFLLPITKAATLMTQLTQTPRGQVGTVNHPNKKDERNERRKNMYATQKHNKQSDRHTVTIITSHDITKEREFCVEVFYSSCHLLLSDSIYVAI